MSTIVGSQQNRVHGIDLFKSLVIVSALGIVYGDIGTSPLYVFRAIGMLNGGHFDERSALGSMSLIFWTLIVIVTVKYALVVMRADNRGEGGILTLTALTRASWHGRNRYLIACGLVGAALLYGDGMITPAISVLSAVEGLKSESNDFAPYTMPIAAAILLLLFFAQRYGTAAIGGALGPVMLVWFIFIAVLGALGVGKTPHVLVAVDPGYAASFLVREPGSCMAILGAVFLCATGAEAMYADMGQFGRAPIRVAWTAIVLPALLLNYGPNGGRTRKLWRRQQSVLQSCPGLAALSGRSYVNAGNSDRQPGDHHGIVLSDPASDSARLASRNAHQADLVGGSGASYVPFVNWAMMLGTLALTVTFASSDRLAGAYGAAVSTTMLMTTAILYESSGYRGDGPLGARSR